jgi:cbb3-type cytochrome oxidase maturation protein
MIVIFFLIPLSIIVAVCFLGLFIWAVRSGQYEDTCTPSMRLLLEEKKTEKAVRATEATETEPETGRETKPKDG